MESMIEKHPQKSEIIKMLLGGMSSRKIAASVSPPLDFHVVQRFNRSVVRPAASKVAIAQSVASKAVQGIADVSPHLARIAQRQADIDETIGAAKTDGDGRTVAALVTADLKGIELAMRATGLLDTAAHAPGVDITVQVMLGIPRELCDPAIETTVEVLPPDPKL